MVAYAHAQYQFSTPQPAPPPRNMSINPYLTPQDSFGLPLTSSTHARRRTSSSEVFPASPAYEFYHVAGAEQPNAYSQPSSSYYPITMHKQRTSSTSTSSSSSQLKRSGSTNTTASGAPPASSYVAALRRQKATVWCEKSQPEDARLLAAQKAARLRAMEVVGSSSSKGRKGGNHGLRSGSSSTTSLRGGRTHHKLGKGGYGSSSADIGTGSLINRPPPRLSATEANGDSSDDDELPVYMGTHRRSTSGSGRSSLNSNHRTSNRAPVVYISGHRNSSASDMQRNHSGRSASSKSPNRSYVELADSQQQQPQKSHTPHILEETSADMAIASAYFSAPPPLTDKAALKRSGSVDEGEARTMAMSGLRLVVANPD